jgi:hypothetical protein
VSTALPPPVQAIDDCFETAGELVARMTIRQ